MSWWCQLYKYVQTRCGSYWCGWQVGYWLVINANWENYVVDQTGLSMLEIRLWLVQVQVYWRIWWHRMSKVTSGRILHSGPKFLITEDYFSGLRLIVGAMICRRQLVNRMSNADIGLCDLEHLFPSSGLVWIIWHSWGGENLNCLKDAGCGFYSKEKLSDLVVLIVYATHRGEC